MKKLPLFNLLVAVLLTACSHLAAQQSPKIELQVTADSADWLYEPGQPVTFSVQALADGQPLAVDAIRYAVGPEKFPLRRETLALPVEGLQIEGGTLQEPGFIQCIVTAEIEGKSYRGLATVGFAPEKIEATQTEPKDFDAFWQKGLEALAKLPLDPRMELIESASNEKINVYHVSFRNIGPSDSRIYGILCVPKAPGRYPAVLAVPGAGVRPYHGVRALAEKGVITLQIGIHGIPVNLPDEVYKSLRAGALQGYQYQNLDHAESLYYRRVFLGCVRANDFIASLPEYDGETLVVMGGSQGGLLSIVTAALDPRVKALASSYPAYADVTGYLYGRAGGWPHMMRARSDGTPSRHATPEKIANTGYFDAVNFAKRIKVPGFYTWGFNDVTCPPTSMYAAYNQITAPKELFIAKEMGHSLRQSQRDKQSAFLDKELGLKP